jgi:S-adenosylmethionine-diacylglycerol 3-amino-3-carboxypropyl transferase
MADPSALGRRILYSQCWEDVTLARAALRIPAGGHVLAIGAAGDNVLALLADDPALVLAVDVNPRQSALVELKQAAFRSLPIERVVGFLGAAPAKDRLEVYGHLRPALSAAARACWDGAERELAGGVIHAGRFERYLAAFRRWVLPVAPGRPAVRALLAATDVAQQERIYEQYWDSRRWRTLFRIFFSRRLLAAFGRHPAAFDHATVGDVGAHFLRRARIGMTGTRVDHNPFVTYALTGGYRWPNAIPDYLRPEVARLIQARADRLEVRTQSIIDLLSELPDHSIDAFYLSDVFEVLDRDAFEFALDGIARVGRPGARVCYWNNLVDRRRPSRIADVLDSHDELAERLYREDRAFLYSRFVVESVRPRHTAGATPARTKAAARAD